ncbi:hypothetical protein FOZ61_007006, partial [Perkinsus olseni]
MGAGPSYIKPVDLPAGNYSAVIQGGSFICPDLPMLTAFKMVVTDGLHGQVARFYAGGLDGGPSSSSTPWAIGSAGEVDLVWYEPGTVRSLRRFGSFSIRWRPKCFHGSSGTTTLLHQFGDELYARLHLQTPSSARSPRNIIVCDTELGIILGIKGNVRKQWNYTEYGILLERQQSADMAAVSATSGATESTDDHIHTILFNEAEDRIKRGGGRERVQAVSLPAET